MRRLKAHLIEAIKYDWRWAKVIPMHVISLYVLLMRRLHADSLAFKITSRVYQFGWPNSKKICSNTTNLIFKTESARGARLVERHVRASKIPASLSKFEQDPKKLLDTPLRVVKSAREDERGLVIAKYNHYFPLLHQLIDLDKVLNRYNVVLEPSWAGYCNLDLLSVTRYEEPVFVMAYEPRDYHLLKESTTLVPIDVGPSWFVDHRVFCPPAENCSRDIDIVMVAAWAKYKRHDSFFKALNRVRKSGHELNVTLVGYPGDLDRQQIIDYASQWQVADWITTHEWITPAEVATILQRSRVNILWSRFEGNNRALAEGMFCGTPAILREGHNYGYRYEFINKATGCYANESNLPKKIMTVLNNPHEYKTREYVMNHRNCLRAMSKINQTVKEHETQVGRAWTTDAVPKVNELHGMKYFDAECTTRFDADYAFLRSCVRPSA